MTNSDTPRPKLRVTVRCVTPDLPQASQSSVLSIDREDVELARRTDFGDAGGDLAIDRSSLDDVFGFAGRAVTLPLDNLPGEENSFEIEDREIVIFEFFRCMERY